MTLHLSSTRLVLCVASLALVLAGIKVPAVKRFCAYGAAILVLVYVCSLAGAAAGILMNSRDYATAAIGFFGGVIMAVLLGIPLGRAALAYGWLYWLLVLAVAFIIIQMKPLL